MSSNNSKESSDFYSSIINYEIQSNLKFLKKLKKSNMLDASSKHSNRDQILKEIENSQINLLNLVYNIEDVESLDEIQEVLENSLQDVEKFTRITQSDRVGSESNFSTLETSGINERNTFEKLSNIEKKIQGCFKTLKEFQKKEELRTEVDKIMSNLDNVIQASHKQLESLCSKYSVRNKPVSNKTVEKNLSIGEISKKNKKPATISKHDNTKFEKEFPINHTNELNVLSIVRYTTEFPLMKKYSKRVSLLPTTLFNDSITLQEFRKGIIGRNTLYNSPFGELVALYADDTASGRPHKVVEKYISSILPLYANTHSENSHYAVTLNALFHSAQKYLHEFYNAPSNYVVIGTGNGSSGAIHHWQETLNKKYPGVFTDNIAEEKRREEEGSTPPIVLVTEYEHHSNIISWTNWGCEVQPILHTAGGNWNKGIIDLENKLNQYKSRPLIIVSTTAASNITSQKTPIVEISDLLKSFKTKNPELSGKVLWSVDLAAYASHNKLDISLLQMDAVFVSIHKLTGGPGSCGILIFNLDHYAHDLPPTRPAGGTVDLVYGYKPSNIVYTKDIASRETPGTPGILQFIRSALTYQLQDSLGYNLIKQREHELTAKFFEYIKNMNLQWEKNGMQTRIRILGPSHYHERLSVLAVIIIDKSGDEIPFKLSHRILSDLFGIQTRSGCNCAGPFGVELLNIDKDYIEDKAAEISKGNFELKNVYGWLRFNIHFSFTDEDLNYLLNSLGFIAENAFIIRDKLYVMKNLNWVLKRNSGLEDEDFNFSLGMISKNTILDVRKPFNVKEVAESERNSYLIRNFDIAEKVLRSITK